MDSNSKGIEMPSPQGEAALYYAQTMGWAVFPVHSLTESGKCSCGWDECGNVGKHPRCENGKDDATTDAEQIRAWWTAHPHSNIGIRTGKESGVFVLDIDPRHGGDVSLAKLKEVVGGFPETLVVKTGGGGWHYFFANPSEGIRSRSNSLGTEFPGLDTRGEGGYVVGAPGSHVAGNYEWLTGLPTTEKLAAAPEALLGMLPKPGASADSEQKTGGGEAAEKLWDPSEGSPATTNDGASRIPASLRHDHLLQVAIRECRQGKPKGMVLAIVRWEYENRCAQMPPKPLAELEKIVEWAHQKLGIDSETGWEEPEPLREALLPVPPMPPEMIPPALRAWVVDSAKRMSVPVDYSAATAVVAAGSLIGNRLGIRPKRHDDWVEYPNLWGGVVGEPGTMKTPATSEALSPLRRLEAAAFDEHKTAAKDAESAAEVAKCRRQVLERKLKKALELGEDIEVLRTELASLGTPEPTRKRYIINDATTEKLCELLTENPTGMLQYRDELAGWLASLEKMGRENDRSFYLESWRGSGSYTSDRIGRGTITVDPLCMSVFGTIQPGPLASYLRAVFHQGSGADGLIQRFQVMVFPDPAKFEHVDQWPDSGAKLKATQVFNALADLVPSEMGAESDLDGAPFLHFAEDAQDFFDGWRANLEERVRSPEEHPAFANHLVKFRKLMPALALIFHCIEGKPGAVSVDAAKRAAQWCSHLEAHARRLYTMAMSENVAGAKLIAKRLKDKKLISPFTMRDIYRHHWVGLTEPTDVESAVRVLEDAGWVRGSLADNKKGGRPKVQYTLNPRLNLAEALKEKLPEVPASESDPSVPPEVVATAPDAEQPF